MLYPNTDALRASDSSEFTLLKQFPITEIISKKGYLVI